MGSLIIGRTRTILSGLTNTVTAKIFVFMMIIVLIRFKPGGLFCQGKEVAL